MTIIHVHTDRDPIVAQLAIESIIGFLPRCIISTDKSPSILAIHTERSRAHVAGLLASLPEIVLPNMTNPASLPASMVAHLKKHHPEVAATDTMATAFAKIHSKIGPIAEFNPDFF